MKTALFVASALVAVPLLYYAFFHESEEGITYDMVEQFAKGVDSLTQKDLVASVKRDELRAHLRMILAPDSITHRLVILGEKGVGKSTAMRQTLADLEEPRGAVYLMTPSSGRDTLLDELADVVTYRQSLDLMARVRRLFAGVTKSVSNTSVDYDALWARLERKLKVVGAACTEKYGRPPVLIVDGHSPRK